jgi:amino acid transporter
VIYYFLYLAKSYQTKTPVNAVWFNVVVGILLTLLIFGGTYAISAIFSIAAVAAFVAFTIPIFIRVFFVGNRFRPGPWNLGRYSLPIGVAACAFVLLMTPILCFPSLIGSDLDPTTMNWTCLVYGGPMFFVMIWWVVDARKWFKGPKVNIEHMMLDRDPAQIADVIEGHETSKANAGDESSGSEKDKDVTRFA